MAEPRSFRYEVDKVWHAVALCVGHTDLYYSDDPLDQLAAKGICTNCAVRPQCLAAALRRGEPDGIWAGYTTPERDAIVARLRWHAATA
jgi:WhiB family transcriptional regulator, redox-sensing transcriptional regulator